MDYYSRYGISDELRKSLISGQQALTQGRGFDETTLTYIGTYMEQQSLKMLGKAADDRALSSAKQAILQIPGEGEGLGLIKRLDEAISRAVDAACGRTS